MDAFGSHLKPLWHLNPDVTFLNHGSFGACPIEVLAAQSAIREEMEFEPDQFFRKKGAPDHADNALRKAAARLADVTGTSAGRLAFVVNATEAVTTVLQAMDLKEGDEVLVLDCVYNAVRLAVDETCRKTGARLVMATLPIPLNTNDVVDRILACASERTRLAIIDHIASPTGVVLPAKEITAALKAKGARVLVDGAHALGQIDLDLEEIGADWYTSNAHKWAFAPKGCALFYAAGDVADRTRPLSISHWHDLGFPQAFDYVGTRDISAFLSIGAALDFMERFGAADIRAYQADLSRVTVDRLAPLGLSPTAPDSAFAAMRTFVLPQTREVRPEDAATLMADLFDHHKIQVAASAFQNKLLLRLSAQIYLERSDIEHLADVLSHYPWPGRG